MKRSLPLFALVLVLGALLGGALGWYFTREAWMRPRNESEPVRLAIKIARRGSHDFDLHGIPGAGPPFHFYVSAVCGTTLLGRLPTEQKITIRPFNVAYSYAGRPREVFASGVITMRYTNKLSKNVEMFIFVTFEEYDAKRQLILFSLAEGLTNVTIREEGGRSELSGEGKAFPNPRGEPIDILLGAPGTFSNRTIIITGEFRERWPGE